MLESEPNGAPTSATPVGEMPSFVSCIGDGADVDFYELLAPSDAAGGFYTFELTNISGFTPWVGVHAAGENDALIADVGADLPGQNLFMFFATAPGARHRLSVSPYLQSANGPGRYTFTWKYTRIADPFEPNNTRETATRITVGTPVTAFLTAGHVVARVPLDDLVDVYRVTLAEGPTTIKVGNVASNAQPWIALHREGSQAQVAFADSPMLGADNVFSLERLEAGDYYITIGPYGPIYHNVHFGRTDRPAVVPDNYTRPYTLTVTQ